MGKDMIFGGWSINTELIEDNTQIPQEYLDIFNEAVEGIDGVGYVPLIYCGSQLVSGHNYMFIARQTLVLQSPEYHVVNLMIHKPLNKKATINKVDVLL